MLVVLGCLLIPVSACAQPRYANALLQTLAHQLHIDTLRMDDGTHALRLSDTDSLVVEQRHQTITHIGYALFNPSMRQKAVFRFLERYVLMLNHPPQGKTLRQMLRDDEVKMLKGAVANIRTLKATDHFSCQQTDLRYEVRWTRGDTVLLWLQFPASYQLLSGDTKVEAESRLANHLATMGMEGVVPIDIALQRYGYAEETFHTTLQQWNTFCQQTGCELQYAVEGEEPGLLHASLLAVNKDEGYNHVMSLTLSDRGNSATLHAYVPMHNVRQLFAANRKANHKKQKTYVK